MTACHMSYVAFECDVATAEASLESSLETAIIVHNS